MRHHVTKARLALTLIAAPALGCALPWTVAISFENPTLVGVVPACSILAPAAFALGANGDLSRRKQLGYALASGLLTLLAIMLVGGVLVATLGEIGPSNNQ